MMGSRQWSDCARGSPTYQRPLDRHRAISHRARALSRWRPSIRQAGASQVLRSLELLHLAQVRQGPPYRGLIGMPVQQLPSSLLSPEDMCHAYLDGLHDVLSFQQDRAAGHLKAVSEVSREVAANRLVRDVTACVLVGNPVVSILYTVRPAYVEATSATGDRHVFTMRTHRFPLSVVAVDEAPGCDSELLHGFFERGRAVFDKCRFHRLSSSSSPTARTPSSANSDTAPSCWSNPSRSAIAHSSAILPSARRSI